MGAILCNYIPPYAYAHHYFHPKMKIHAPPVIPSRFRSQATATLTAPAAPPPPPRAPGNRATAGPRSARRARRRARPPPRRSATRLPRECETNHRRIIVFAQARTCSAAQRPSSARRRRGGRRATWRRFLDGGPAPASGTRPGLSRGVIGRRRPARLTLRALSSSTTWHCARTEPGPPDPRAPSRRQGRCLPRGGRCGERKEGGRGPRM